MRLLIIALTVASLGFVSAAYADDSVQVPPTNGIKAETPASKPVKEMKKKNHKKAEKKAKETVAPAVPAPEVK